MARKTRASAAPKPNLTRYRVEVAYRTKRHGVLLGCREDAVDEGRAYMQAVQRHIRPFKARKLLHVKVEQEAV